MFVTVQTAYRYIFPVPPPTPPSTQESSSWFRLPLELREEIYTYIFSNHASTPLYISPKNGSVLADRIIEHANHTALLRTCKAIHADALPILHATHTINLLLCDPQVLSRQPSPPSPTPIVYLPETPVCTQQYMLQLLTYKLKRVTITVRLTSVSPYTLIVKKIAWLLEMLRRRETKLEHLTLHVLNNLTARSGCCSIRKYAEGIRWDVYPETVTVESSDHGSAAGSEKGVFELLDGFADKWEVLFSNNEARLSMGHDAEWFWNRLRGDVLDVERALEERRSWWSGVASVDVWETISERRDHF